MNEAINMYTFYTILGWDNIKGYFFDKVDQLKGAFIK